MAERLKPSTNLRAELAQSAETERCLTAVVEEIKDAAKGKNHWKVIYYTAGADTHHINVWDPKLVEGLQTGDVVELALKRNDKGYWDIVSLTKSDKQSPTTTENPTQAPLTRQEAAKYAPRYLDPKEQGMRSMNALTNAVGLVTTLIEKDILKPADGKEAFVMVSVYHEQMLHLHDPKKGEHS